MPYPPTVPPASRSNATVQADNHPSDHDLISVALTEIINHIAETEVGARVDGGFATLTPTIMPGGGTVLHVPVSPVQSFVTRMYVTANLATGSDSSALSGAKGAVITQVSGTNQPLSPGASTQGANDWVHIPLVWSWLVPADGSPQFAVNSSWNGGALGAVYATTDIQWQRYRV